MENESYIKNEYVLINKIVKEKLEILSKQIELNKNSEIKNKRVVILLDTVGGSPNSVINMVTIIRRLFNHVIFIIKDKAISAGTLFSLSGDEIYMNNLSSIGALDLQIKLKKQDKSLNVIRERINKLKEETSGNTRNPALLNVLKETILESDYYDSENDQIIIRQRALEYLTKYHFKNFEELDEEKKKNIRLIPDKLIDKELLEEEEIFYHDTRIYIDTAKKIGLDIKNYEEIFPEIKDIIDEFFMLNIEYSNFWGADKYCIYSRLVKNIPKILETKGDYEHRDIISPCVKIIYSN